MTYLYQVFNVGKTIVCIYVLYFSFQHKSKL